MLAVGKRGRKEIPVFNLCIHTLLISRALTVKRQFITINTGQSHFENSDIFEWPFRMIFNIQEKCAPVKELVQAHPMILRIRNIHQKCQQPIQVYEIKSYAEVPAFLDYCFPCLPPLYIFHHPYSWLLVCLNVGGGDTVEIKLHLSAAERKQCEGTKSSEISTG